MQHPIADLEAHYARLPNQPNLQKIWAFHQRLVLLASQRGRSEDTREFTVVYPNPNKEVDAPGSGEASGNKDLESWQAHMAWEYGTDLVAGFLVHQRQYVMEPLPANVSLWPTAPLTHPESDESQKEEGNNAEASGAGGTQGITASSGPVMAPPSIAPLSLQPLCPPSQRRRLQRRSKSLPQLLPPRLWQQHLPRCQRPSPQPKGSAPQQLQEHICPGNGPLPPKSTTQSGLPWR
jgi:hypothetical protein